MKTLRRYQYNKVYSTRHAGTMVEAGSRSSPVTPHLTLPSILRVCCGRCAACSLPGRSVKQLD